MSRPVTSQWFGAEPGLELRATAQDGQGPSLFRRQLSPASTFLEGWEASRRREVGTGWQRGETHGGCTGPQSLRHGVPGPVQRKLADLRTARTLPVRAELPRQGGKLVEPTERVTSKQATLWHTCDDIYVSQLKSHLAAPAQSHCFSSWLHKPGYAHKCQFWEVVSPGSDHLWSGQVWAVDLPLTTLNCS